MKPKTGNHQKAASNPSEVSDQAHGIDDHEDNANCESFSESEGDSEDDFMHDSEEDNVVVDATDNDDQAMQEEDRSHMHTQHKVFLPGVDTLAEDEELDYDSSAYDMYHAITAEWPALSIDILRDDLGNCRTQFPMTVFMVAGSQALKSEENQITIMKMTELHRSKTSQSDSDDSDSENNTDHNSVLHTRTIPHKGGINRIRSMHQSSSIVATWSDTGKVHIWDISTQLDSLNGNDPSIATKVIPVQTFHGHPEEGFAMDWSLVSKGHLLTGDCSKFIYRWLPQESAWVIDKVPFSGHQSSIEDLQWSPNEATVFASGSADKTIRIWDTRRKAGSMINVTGHDDDVNVLSWNRNVAHLLASGSDDGSFKIWDLRNFKAETPVAHFRYHTAPITSLEWHPCDESVIAVSGADNQISIWDLSVEEDVDASDFINDADSKGVQCEVPPQLLFIHQGQKDIKELHFHPQCPGVLVSTAGDGFNVFKPANIS